MNIAIDYLKNTLSMLETNEPINRASGNIEQADLELKSAVEIKDAINKLSV